MNPISLAVLAFVATATTTASAHAAPCDDWLSPSGAQACRAAFVADPAAPPDLGGGIPGAPSADIGVNLRLGDLSFVLAHGRLPTAADSEAVRMRLHLDLARDILLARAATAPAHTARRATLLAALAQYRDKGTIPLNRHTPRRTPVFIDDSDRICAVGYLIEQSAGRALAEDVASAFRYAYLREMDHAGLAAWVATSGFTLAELALIQPAYSWPTTEYWATFVGPLRSGVRPPDGSFTLMHSAGMKTRGAWKDSHMHGLWERLDANGATLGSGEFVRGKGHWVARHASGALAVVGDYLRDAPTGAWTAYYPSGNIAIEARFKDAVRTGTWRYYFDAPGRPLMARGRYAHVERGDWEHWDRTGRHIATSHTRHKTVSWYDEAGVLVGAEGVNAELVGASPGVAWDPSTGMVTHARLDLSAVVPSAAYEMAELRFDARGSLVMAIARSDILDDGTATSLVMTFAAGQVVAAWWAARPDWDGTPGRLARLPVAGLDPTLATRLVRRAERAARGHNGSMHIADRARIATAFNALIVKAELAELATLPESDPELLASFRPLPIAPKLTPRSPVPPLLDTCTSASDEDEDEDEAPTVEAWACDTDPAAQIQQFVLRLPTMVTDGTNFAHLEARSALLMAFLPDRSAPDTTFMDETGESPSWLSMPALPEGAGLDDTFGLLSSTYAPMLGRR